MQKQDLLARISIDPAVMVGQPCIRGTRLTVHHILNLLAFGTTIEDLVGEYDGITRQDVLACLLFASESLASTTFTPLVASAT